jgi:hypothetical protein
MPSCKLYCAVTKGGKHKLNVVAQISLHFLGKIKSPESKAKLVTL